MIVPRAMGSHTGKVLPPPEGSWYSTGRSLLWATQESYAAIQQHASCGNQIDQDDSLLDRVIVEAHGPSCRLVTRVGEPAIRDEPHEVTAGRRSRPFAPTQAVTTGTSESQNSRWKLAHMTPLLIRRVARSK